MRQVRLTHPSGLETQVPETAVAEHLRAGWVIDETEHPVPCPACGQPLGGASPPDPEPDQAPAESGASSSPAPRGRRKSSKETD